MMVFKGELQEWGIFKFCKHKFFSHVWPFVRLDLSWWFNEVGVFANKCAARAPLVIWNRIVALSQNLTLAPDLPGYVTAAVTSESSEDAPVGRCSLPAAGALAVTFLQLSPDTNLWDNTTPEPSPPVTHPLLSLQWLIAVHRKKKTNPKQQQTRITISATSADPVYSLQHKHGQQTKAEAGSRAFC